MKRKIIIYSIALFLSACAFSASAQLSAPQVEGVYGGTIRSMAAYVKTGDTSRIFISTESANSIFYADVYTGSSGPKKFGKFRKMPGATAESGFGSGINAMAAHAGSGVLYFGHNMGLYAVHPDSIAASKCDSFGVNSLVIKDSNMVFLEGNRLIWGKLSAKGKLTVIPGSFINLAIPPQPGTLAIHPLNNKVYLFLNGPSPALYVSSANYNNLISSTTFSAISLTGLRSPCNWSAMGIAPNGRIFLGGAYDTMPFGQAKIISYSDNNGVSWTNNSTSIAGGGGSNFSFAGAATSYLTYFSTAFSTNKGVSWTGIGTLGFETHPNDGAIMADPGDTNIVYLTTDQGIGASVNRGNNIFEIDDGVEALQVNDFDMTSDKKTAWLASKSGIRKVSNYTASPAWSRAIFPNNDGSPYYAAQMVAGDSNRVYVGNLRVYKSNDAGLNWQMLFSPENAPYNFGPVGAACTAIEVASFDSNIVFATYAAQGTSNAGVFYSMNAGLNWSQLLIRSTVIGQDIDASDVIFNIEGPDTLAYVSSTYDTITPSGRSVYRIKKTGLTWTPVQNFDAAYTSTSSIIVASINDLQCNPTGDTLYAAGTDAGSNHPVVYMKPVAYSNKWTPLPTAGFPFFPGKNVSAVSLGHDTLYSAVDNELYVFPLKSGHWLYGYSYPVGTVINFLYFDDLLAGTGTGLYGHRYTEIPCQPALFENISAGICSGDSFFYHGNIIKLPGLYADTLKSRFGCDSVFSALNLQVYNKYAISNAANICDGEIYTFPDGYKSGIPGSHVSLMKSANGCDSLVTITLTVNRPDVSMIVAKDTLISNQAGALYQWLDCNAGMGPVAGANGKTFIPQHSGSYAVVVSKLNCTDTSTCFFIQLSAIEDLENLDKYLKIFPNPVGDVLNIEMDLRLEQLSISIINVEGKEMIFEKSYQQSIKSIDLSGLSNGIYIVKAEVAGGGLHYFKIVKQ